MSQAAKDEVLNQVRATLVGIGIKIPNIGNHIAFDTEENCERDNNGNWKQRLTKTKAVSDYLNPS